MNLAAMQFPKRIPNILKIFSLCNGHCANELSHLVLKTTLQVDITIIHPIGEEM